MKTAAMIISTLAVILLGSASVVAQQMAGTPASPEATTSNTGEQVRPVQIDAKSFDCIRDMTLVRHFYMDNVLGNLDTTLAVANSATGGTYPAGTVIQVIPQEAMVKREKGLSPETHDWEFFALEVSKDGTKIRQRGFDKVVNSFGQCLGCHKQAGPQWDLVCEMGHGCAPIPTTREMFVYLQKKDPRCKPVKLSPVDIEAGKQLQELLKQ